MEQTTTPKNNGRSIKPVDDHQDFDSQKLTKGKNMWSLQSFIQGTLVKQAPVVLRAVVTYIRKRPITTVLGLGAVVAATVVFNKKRDS